MSLLTCCLVLAAMLRAQASADGDQLEFSIFVGGDSVIALPWMGNTNPEFLKLLGHVRAADVAISNLETTLGEFKSYPQRYVGGMHLMGRSSLAHDLAWAGFDMFSLANNHTFDYGSNGVLATINSLSMANIAIAGAGESLQSARRPTYFQINGRTVALVSITSTFLDYAVAGRSRHDMPGRPGPGPLAINRADTFEKFVADVQRFLVQQVSIFGVGMSEMRIRKIDQSHLDEILDSISIAKERADYVVLSIHAHETGVWIEDFARMAIDKGVDIFFAHGPHTVAGVEIYRNRPIFYGLGNFVFQYEYLKRLPADAFEDYDLDPDAPIAEYFEAAHGPDGILSFPRRPETWEGLGAIVTFSGPSLSAVSLLPIDLGFDEERPVRELPLLASGSVRETIIYDVVQKSKRFGTNVDTAGDSAASVFIPDNR
jgi:poly-gamma-glutamate capsule biosynthesis protein CapA/YwtB (metallophosphatase superfamily)